MKINEVEKLLNIPRATIRFYEKEGLLSPQRKENAYRDYSDADVELLKKIIVLRKIGIPVEVIKQVLGDDLSLQEAVCQNISALQEQIQELEGALKLCELIQKKEDTLKTFDESYYWNMIHTEEEKGSKFFEIVNDVIRFEKHVIANEFNLLDASGNLKFPLGKSILVAGTTCVAGGTVWFLLDGMNPESFWEGFFLPFIGILLSSLFGLPIYFLEKKHPKAARILKKIGMGLCIAFVAALLLLVLFLEEV